MSDNRPSVYWEDDNLIIRASAIGTSCMWELVAAGQGHEPGILPQSLVRAFGEGTRLEDIVIEKLEVMGWTFFTKQIEGELILPNNIFIRYHPDGIGTPLTPRYAEDELGVIEVKCLGDDLWQKAVRHGVGSTIGEYPWQLSVMMYGERKSAAWVAYNKGKRNSETGELEECEDYGKLHIEYVFNPPIPLHEIVFKAQQIRELVQGEDIIESGRECDDPKHWPCRYLHLRPETKPEPKSVHIRSDNEEAAEIDHLVREYLSHKGFYDENKQRYEAARDKLIGLAGEDKILLTDRWQVPIVEGTGASRLDFNAMPQELREEIEKYRVQGKKYKYLRGIKRLD